MLNYSTAWSPGRKKEPRLDQAYKHGDQEDTSELNYISQPISALKHWVLFIVKVGTKRKTETNPKKA